MWGFRDSHHCEHIYTHYCREVTVWLDGEEECLMTKTTVLVSVVGGIDDVCSSQGMWLCGAGSL